jgi:TPR repeat protein
MAKVRRKKRGAGAAPKKPTPVVPTRRIGIAAALVPALAMAAFTLLPGMEGRAEARLHVWIGAGMVAALTLYAWFRRGALEAEIAPRRVHYMQAITQSCVYLYWGWYWEPVRRHVPLVVVQVALAYGCDMLLCWWRGRRFVLGFGQLPIVFSCNLFLWFRDAWFGWQLCMIAACFAGKELVRWTRGGQNRHVFNPSAFGLAIASIVLIATKTTAITWARDIASTQDQPPQMHVLLFLVGFIVQLQFPVVLVTMSAAVTTWLLGVLYFAATGTYLFTITAIPAAVLLGMLLLVTDPATSPSNVAGKVLFGIGYGLLVCALYLPLEVSGGFGYFDKLLPVPILNLLVPRLERWGEAIDARFAKAAWLVGPSSRFVHVGIWTVAFLGLRLGGAVGPDFPGREIAFWEKACAAKRWRACTSYLSLLAVNCDNGIGVACHDLGVEIEERVAHGMVLEGQGAAHYYELACKLGVQASCQILAEAKPGARPALGDDALAGMQQACDAGNAAACHNLGHLYAGGQGVPADIERAKALYDRACQGGVVQGCSSLAAIEMREGGGDKVRAAGHFRTACDAGDAAGCTNLASMYALGQGVERDLARAAALLERACGAGLGVGCARLAEAYDRGEGVTADATRAAALRTDACRKGFAPACGH